LSMMIGAVTRGVSEPDLGASVRRQRCLPQATDTERPWVATPVSLRFQPAGGPPNRVTPGPSRKPEARDLQPTPLRRLEGGAIQG
jgi:hypothetical protein